MPDKLLVKATKDTEGMCAFLELTGFGIVNKGHKGDLAWITVLLIPAICFGLTYLCCPCIIGYEMRSELRHVEDIDGSYLQDLLCMWCCHPCNLCQMYGHVRLKVRATMAIAPDLPATYEKPACDMER